MTEWVVKAGKYGAQEAAYPYVQSKTILNHARLESPVHRFLEPAKLNIATKDHFGSRVIPREWFLVSPFVIDEAVEKIKYGSSMDFFYDAKVGKIEEGQQV